MTGRDSKPPSDANDWDASGRPDDRPIGDALAQHHRGLEEAFKATVARAKIDADPSTARAAWDAFERELLAHMAIEEKDLFPWFGRVQPEEARALQAEHDVIRARLFELGLALDLRRLGTPAIDEFAARLRAHALREDLMLYPWTERHLSHDTWHTLNSGLCDAEALARIASSRN
jgi:hemerythrin-like domain-containing protein